MGELVSPDGTRFGLTTQMRIGRSSNSHVRLGDLGASGSHARIMWDRAGWAIKDLASRNGTYVDGTRVEPGTWVPLREDARIRFGASAETWVLSSARPPEAHARELSTGELLFAQDGVLVFEPDSEQPHVGVLEAETDRIWLALDGARRPVRDGTVVSVGARSWRLVLPPDEVKQVHTAARALESTDVTLRFEVSADEEHVRLSLDTGLATIALRGRSFDYMLLCLARARLEDERADDLPLEERGWVDTLQLARSLRMDAAHLNVNVHRARRHFAAAGVAEPERTVERRTGARQLRLGFARLWVGPPNA